MGKSTSLMAVVAGATALLPATGKATVPEQDTKPNVVFILMDDLGYGDLGCYGQTKIETPNIDALRSRGMMFTQFYSGSPVSAPSRCVLMTGLHSGHAQIRGNDEMRSRGAVWSHDSMTVHPRLEGQYPLKEGTFTIGHMMRRAGYVTACIGKWGLGYPGSSGTPDKQGFDHFFGYNCQRMAHNYYPPHLWRNNEKVQLDNVPLDPSTHPWKSGADAYDLANYALYTQNDYACDMMCDEVEAFVEREKGHPFFLLWATPLPHVPLQAPDRWVDYYRKKFGDESPYTGQSGYYPCRYPHATYAAMVSYFDEQVGRLVDKLKMSGVYENTVIIFTSDNGPTFNGGTDSPWFNSGGLFKSERGWGKCYLKEGGIRVPFIVSWPGVVEESSSSSLMACFQDMMPTLAAMAGAEPPTVCDGISIFPAITGKGRQKKHDFLYWEFTENEGSRAIRRGDWKLIVDNIHKGPQRIMLFNLKKDLREQQNVADEHPRMVDELLSLMRSQWSEPENPRFLMRFE